MRKLNVYLDWYIVLIKWPFYNTQGQNYIFAWVQGSLILHSCIHFGVVFYITFCIHFLYHERSPWLQVFVIVQNLISFPFEKFVSCNMQILLQNSSQDKRNNPSRRLFSYHGTTEVATKFCHKSTLLHAEWALELPKSSFQNLGWYLSMEFDLQPPINGILLLAVMPPPPPPLLSRVRSIQV